MSVFFILKNRAVFVVLLIIILHFSTVYLINIRANYGTIGYGQITKTSSCLGNYNHLQLCITLRKYPSRFKEKLLEFLTEEERKDVLTPRDQEEKPRGLELTGLDQNGKLYKLCYKLWASLNKTAINKQWNKLIFQHNAKKGDWVEIWGYRVINNEDENKNGPRFVINFRKNDPNMQWRIQDFCQGCSD